MSLRSRAARVRPRTLRTRIVAAVAVLLVAGFAAVGVITTLIIHRVLLDRLDAQLQAAGTRYSVSLEHDDHDADNDSDQFGEVEGQAAGTLGARVKDGAVTAAAVVGRRDGSRVPTASAERVLASLRADGTPRSIELPGLGAYRVLVSDGRDGDLLITGLPLDGLRQTTGKIVLIEAIVFTAAVVAIGLASALVVRRALRPLAQVAEIASNVADLPLSRGAVSLPDRAPPGGSGSEIDTVATAFNTMLEEVESALATRHDSEERLRRFLADASHELRTPVAVVRSHADYALRARAEVPDEVAHALERIAAQSERMGHLVEDLLLLARLDSGRPLAADDVDLTRVVLDAVSDARTVGPDHRWALDLPDEAVVVTGDENGLRQVVANLLANARTHTPPGTSVRAGVLRDGGTVIVFVHDDGPGIPSEAQGQVFERFVRGDGARSHTTGSSGLGLPIVEAIVAAHGGTVTLTSATAGTSRPAGTRVDVALPTHPASTGAVPGAPEPTQNSRTAG